MKTKATPAAEASTPTEPASPAMPTEGGSYVRDSETGALTRAEWTEQTVITESLLAPPAEDVPAPPAALTDTQVQEG